MIMKTAIPGILAVAALIAAAEPTNAQRRMRARVLSDEETTLEFGRRRVLTSSAADTDKTTANDLPDLSMSVSTSMCYDFMDGPASKAAKSSDGPSSKAAKSSDGPSSKAAKSSDGPSSKAVKSSKSTKASKGSKLFGKSRKPPSESPSTSHLPSANPTTVNPAITFFDSFETEDFPGNNWELFNGDFGSGSGSGRRRRLEEEEVGSDWARSTDEAFDGIYSIMSPDLSNDEFTPRFANVTLTVSEGDTPGILSFAAIGALFDDYFMLIVDGELRMDDIYGFEWKTYEEYLGPGSHEVTWLYVYNLFGEEDPSTGAAFLDKVTLTTTTQIPTSVPTTSWPSYFPTGSPTTDPTTLNPTTANPTTANPTTANPTTANPTTANPTTANPTSKPTVSPSYIPTGSPTTDPLTANPTTANPTTANPTSSAPSNETSDPPTIFEEDDDDGGVDDDEEEDDDDAEEEDDDAGGEEPEE